MKRQEAEQELVANQNAEIDFQKINNEASSQLKKFEQNILDFEIKQLKVYVNKGKNDIEEIEEKNVWALFQQRLLHH